MTKPNQLNTTDTFVTFSGESITFRSAEKAKDDFYEFLGTNSMYYSVTGKVFDDSRQNDCDIDFSATITTSKQTQKEPKVITKVNTNEINKDYTYYNKSGKRVTFEDRVTEDPFYAFVGSNSYFYSKQGTIFEDQDDYLNDIDFTKTPILTSTLKESKMQTKEQTLKQIREDIDSVLLADSFSFDSPEITNTIKRKSKVDGIKRKIKIDRLSDDTLQVTIKTAYPELDKPLVTRFALTYEALDLFEEAIDALHEELKDEAECFCCGDHCSDCHDCQS